MTAVTPRPGTLPDSQHLQVTGRLLLGRCFNDESHKKNRNRNGSAEVSNVRVESFHAASVVCMSLLFFLSPVAKA